MFGIHRHFRVICFVSGVSVGLKHRRYDDKADIKMPCRKFTKNQQSCQKVLFIFTSLSLLGQVLRACVDHSSTINRTVFKILPATVSITINQRSPVDDPWIVMAAITSYNYLLSLPMICLSCTEYNGQWWYQTFFLGEEEQEHGKFLFDRTNTYTHTMLWPIYLYSSQ